MVIRWATRRYSASSIPSAMKFKRFRIAEGSFTTMSKCRATGIRSCQYSLSTSLSKSSNQTASQPTEPMAPWDLKKLQGHEGQLVARTRIMMERLLNITESLRQMAKEQAHRIDKWETKHTNNTNRRACKNQSQRTSTRPSSWRTSSKTSILYTVKASTKSKETGSQNNPMRDPITNPSRRILVSHHTWRNQNQERIEWEKNMKTEETREMQTSMSSHQGATWTMWIKSIRTQARSCWLIQSTARTRSTEAARASW